MHWGKSRSLRNRGLSLFFLTTHASVFQSSLVCKVVHFFFHCRRVGRRGTLLIFFLLAIVFGLWEVWYQIIVTSLIRRPIEKMVIVLHKRMVNVLILLEVLMNWCHGLIIVINL